MPLHVLGGMNFCPSLQALKGNWQSLTNSTELKAYLMVALSLGLEFPGYFGSSGQTPIYWTPCATDSFRCFPYSQPQATPPQIMTLAPGGQMLLFLPVHWCLFGINNERDPHRPSCAVASILGTLASSNGSTTLGSINLD